MAVVRPWQGREPRFAAAVCCKAAALCAVVTAFFQFVLDHIPRGTDSSASSCSVTGSPSVAASVTTCDAVLVAAAGCDAGSSACDAVL
eukprot:9176671-Lingulodinium_polyedra.AAC.1